MESWPIVYFRPVDAGKLYVRGPDGELRRVLRHYSAGTGNELHGCDVRLGDRLEIDVDGVTRVLTVRSDTFITDRPPVLGRGPAPA